MGVAETTLGRGPSERASATPNLALDFLSASSGKSPWYPKNPDLD
jgi:hypothetical protein